ncbi:preQ(1) synthase [Rubellicoccus peritrichatus]|uniref:NADPH-dependent 7-cyano-7-deazaguanine reductase n=1 Tax=Rubellicoccus peritrichatus TaxID=3080537 RepID=A0AAQ3LCN4_9BACT|nr:preQ(1) synthase [Puniceicoccus sp. CR14]WOO42942.1 preQ(1) synthase [Puniceicoccus sp. CR14]
MEIETFPNPNPQRDYFIQHIAEEFTSVCPKTGHPDFATIVLTYVAGETCVELKAYKMYLQAFRNEGIFYEAVTNKICEDMVALLAPRFLRIEARFTGRGGIRSNITAEHTAEGYKGAIPSPFGT